MLPLNQGKEQDTPKREKHIGQRCPNKEIEGEPGIKGKNNKNTWLLNEYSLLTGQQYTLHAYN